jgi:hypothetical protein
VAGQEPPQVIVLHKAQPAGDGDDGRAEGLSHPPQHVRHRRPATTLPLRRGDGEATIRPSLHR